MRPFTDFWAPKPRLRCAKLNGPDRRIIGGKGETVRSGGADVTPAAELAERAARVPHHGRKLKPNQLAFAMTPRISLVSKARSVVVRMPPCAAIDSRPAVAVSSSGASMIATRS